MHDSQCSHGAGEDSDPGVVHGHYGGDEEGLVTQFSYDDHAKGGNECVHKVHLGLVFGVQAL